MAVLSHTVHDEVNALNDLGQTPLHVAYKYGKWENVVHLIRGGADPSVRDARGKLPADYDTSFT